MSIVEKIGFTPGPWEKDYGNTVGHIKSIAPHEKGYTPTVCKYNEFTQLPRSLSVDEIEANGNLIAVAPEMFLWIIGMVKAAGNNDMLKAAQLLELGPELIEKATDKTWEVIKDVS